MVKISFRFCSSRSLYFEVEGFACSGGISNKLNCRNNIFNPHTKLLHLHLVSEEGRIFSKHHIDYSFKIVVYNTSRDSYKVLVAMSCSTMKTFAYDCLTNKWILSGY